ncbi:MAG: MurT ligase domain-containing protein, partial [Dehalococcoidia bacterium]
PDVLVVMNLFRDQLDRYGEVDSITALWRRALARLSEQSTLVLNADDPTVATLAQSFGGRSLFFGVEDIGQAGRSEHAADSRWCGRCGSEYAYAAAFFWHIGHWHCPGCGDARPSPQIAAERVIAGADSVCLTMRTPGEPLTVALPLAGLYNAYNALAATAAALALDVPPAVVHGSLAGFRAAFGRQERLRVRGRDVRVLLCKNPAGVNQVLRTLLADPDPLHLLVILNDGIADGRDVSWIWDVDFELLPGRTASATASGRRAADMALRLKYAGIGGADLTPRPPSLARKGVPRQTMVDPSNDRRVATVCVGSTVPDQAPPSLRGKGDGGLGEPLAAIAAPPDTACKGGDGGTRAMKAESIKGMAVVSVADGAKLGRVDDLIFDPAERRMVALRIDADKQHAVIPLEQIKSIGSDAITVPAREVAQWPDASSPLNTFPRLGAIERLKVVDEAGTFLGEVANVEVDPATGAITGLAAHKGGILGIGRTEHTLTGDEILSIGDEVMVVRMPAPPAEEPRA